jgi:hypothetical protein
MWGGTVLVDGTDESGRPAMLDGGLGFGSAVVPRLLHRGAHRPGDGGGVTRGDYVSWKLWMLSRRRG